MRNINVLLDIVYTVYMCALHAIRVGLAMTLLYHLDFIAVNLPFVLCISTVIATATFSL